MESIGFLDERPVRRLEFDPRTKIAALLIINIVMIGGNIRGINAYARIVAAFVPAVLLLIENKRKVSFIYIAAFTFSTFGEIIVTRCSIGSVNIVFLCMSGIISRFVPGFMMGYYIINNTTVSEFICSMEKMHVTDKLVIPISVMFRYFPTIIEEYHSINMAMKMRGIGFKGKNKSLLTMVEYRLVPIMMSTVKIADELSAASLTKGLGGNIKRTNRCKIGFKWNDIVLMIITGACFIIFFI